ncbi:hypothetical protein F3Y22_tig00110482pilonHSYRG00238 [Hibiscus syriacus]|uniref:Retrovirus-related Pol polyprotein from transposon TNT 1-94-like beta-barrel domain-containing protein n=1 Tax=Hibiscus syriacus TaxID=106335 RepID=A0A6A3AD75_HIBSY|nr:hypothetical protein F3Y22_tig00110482pilonHSYRG00238 [Hibiscus syriacus]
MEHLNTLNTLFSQLTSLRCTIREQERAELLLQSLSDSYDQLIINLTNSNVTSLVFDDVAAVVLQEENRRKNKEDRQVNLQQAEALTTMRGGSTKSNQSSSQKHCRSKSRSKKNLKYYNCGKNDHLKNDCWSLNKNFNPQGNTANTSDDGDDLCCEASTTVEGGSLYSCNDHALEIVGVGTIKLKMYDGTIKVVRDVRHVKGMKKNLLFYGLLDNNASKIETRKGIMKVFRGALVVLKGEKITTNLYMLKGETVLEAKASVASCLEKSFWAEAVNTTCYLVNRAPSTAIELKTPMEMWTSKPADYSNLHVFGSIVYVMYNSQEISKLDPKSRKCKFLGYADGIHVEKEFEQGDSSEAEPTHDEQEPESSEAQITRQSDRVRRRPNWHSDYVIEGNMACCLLIEDGEPSTFHEAINSSYASLWIMAMQEEIEALHKNNTWDLVQLPQGKKSIVGKPEAMRAQMSPNQMEVHLKPDGQQQYAKDERNWGDSYQGGTIHLRSSDACTSTLYGDSSTQKRRSNPRRESTIETHNEFLDEDHGPVVVDHHVWYINTVGLQPSVIDSIAVFKYMKGDVEWRMTTEAVANAMAVRSREARSERLCPRVVFTSAWDSGSLLELTPYGPRDGNHLRMDIRRQIHKERHPEDVPSGDRCSNAKDEKTLHKDTTMNEILARVSKIERIQEQLIRTQQEMIDEARKFQVESRGQMSKLMSMMITVIYGDKSSDDPITQENMKTSGENLNVSDAANVMIANDQEQMKTSSENLNVSGAANVMIATDQEPVRGCGNSSQLQKLSKIPEDATEIILGKAEVKGETSNMKVEPDSKKRGIEEVQVSVRKAKKNRKKEEDTYGSDSDLIFRLVQDLLAHGVIEVDAQQLKIKRQNEVDGVETSEVHAKESVEKEKNKIKESEICETEINDSTLETSLMLKKKIEVGSNKKKVKGEVVRDWPQKMSWENTTLKVFQVPISDLLSPLIKNQYLTPRPLRMKTSPSAYGYDPNSACDFHMGALGHPTDKCIPLMEEIENLVDK